MPPFTDPRITAQSSPIPVRTSAEGAGRREEISLSRAASDLGSPLAGFFILPLCHFAISGQRINTMMVVALKVACIVIVAQSDPVRS